MIFKTLNTTIEKPSYTINIKNLDYGIGHWGSEKDMVLLFEEVNNYLYQQDLEKNMMKLALSIKKNNRRIQDIKFFRGAEGKLIFLVVSDITNFKNFETFSKEYSLVNKPNKFIFSIVEITKEENEKLEIPNNWKIDEYMCKRFEKLSQYL